MSKPKSGKKKDDAKSELKPKLRFPEFCDATAWNEEPLGSQGEFLSSLTGKTAKDFDSGDAKFIPYMNVFSNAFTDRDDLRAVDVKPEDSQNAVSKGDVFFTVSSETPDEAGMSSVLLDDIDCCYLNSFCALFRFDNGKSPNPVFLGYALRSKIARDHLSRGSQGATRYNISKGTFRELPLLFPSRKEQQKIADCLSSLDELIAAHSRKLSALKAHKKGLMQQLFPREGETLPRLRFPEFKDAPEWEVKAISKIAKNLDGKRVPITQKDREKGEIPYYGASGIVDYVRDFIFNEDLLLVSEDGANLLARSTPIAFSISGKTWVNNHAHVLQFKNPATQKVVEDYLNSITLADFITGMAQPKLNKANLNKIPVPLPTDEDEQQQIADCLSNVDELVSAQAAKVDALNDHKKGLMQQLFPSLDEAKG